MCKYTQAHAVSQSPLTLHTSHSHHVHRLRNTFICGCFSRAVLCCCTEVGKNVLKWYSRHQTDEMRYQDVTFLYTGHWEKRCCLWWSLFLFKCKFPFEPTPAVVPSRTLTVCSLFLPEYITDVQYNIRISFPLKSHTLMFFIVSWMQLLKLLVLTYRITLKLALMTVLTSPCSCQLSVPYRAHGFGEVE